MKHYIKFVAQLDDEQKEKFYEFRRWLEMDQKKKAKLVKEI